MSDYLYKITVRFELKRSAKWLQGCLVVVDMAGATCHVKLLPSQLTFYYLGTPYNHASVYSVSLFKATYVGAFVFHCKLPLATAALLAE